MCPTTIRRWCRGPGLALQMCVSDEDQEDYPVVPPICYESHAPPQASPHPHAFVAASPLIEVIGPPGDLGGLH